MTACNTPEEAQSPTMKITSPPTETATVSPTSTATPLPTLEPLPTPDTIGILAEVIERCEEIGFLDVLLPDEAIHPVIALKKIMYDDSADWELLEMPHQAQQSSSINSLLCVRERRTRDGTYSDGSAAFRLTWDIALVGWPDGVIYGAERLRGGSPPISKSGSGDRYGAEPDFAFLSWLGSTFEDLAFFAVGGGLDFDISPDGHYLTNATGSKFARIRSTTDQSDSRTIGTDYDHFIVSIAFSPSGLTVATGHRDADIGLWDVETGEKLMTFSGHSGSVTSIAFSPNGQLFASLSEDNTIKVWSIGTGEEFLSMSGRGGGMAFSSDGSILASAGLDDVVRVTALDTGDELFVIDGSRDFAKSIAISPDDQLFATGGGDNVVRLWSLTDGMEILSMRGHLKSVNSVGFSPNGELLASGSSDNTVRIWDIASGELVSTLLGHTGRVFEVMFLPDGHALASKGSDGTIRFWRLEAGN